MVASAAPKRHPAPPRSTLGSQMDAIEVRRRPDAPPAQRRTAISTLPPRSSRQASHPHEPRGTGSIARTPASFVESGRMPRTPALLPDELGPSFSVAQALSADVSRRRLRAKDLEAPFHGVRRVLRACQPPGEDEDTEPLAVDRATRARVLDSACAYASVMPRGSFFCGRTAAVILGAPIDHGEDLEVAVISPRRAPRGRGISGRRIAAHLVTTRDHEGLPIASPASTWAMLCQSSTERQLIILGDALVRIPRDEFGHPHPSVHWPLLRNCARRSMPGHARRGQRGSPPHSGASESAARRRWRRSSDWMLRPSSSQKRSSTPRSAERMGACSESRSSSTRVSARSWRSRAIITVRRGSSGTATWRSIGRTPMPAGRSCGSLHGTSAATALMRCRSCAAYSSAAAGTDPLA